MRIFDGLLNLLAVCAAGILLVVMFSIGADVTLRTFGGGSLTWGLELSEHALLVLLFFGMPWLAREGGHISVELLTEQLSERKQRVLARVTAVAVAILLFWLAFWAARLSIADWQSSIRTIGLYPIPRFWLSIIVGCGLLLTAMEFMRQALTGRIAEQSKESVA